MAATTQPTASMTTWFVAGGRSVNTSSWAVKEPKSVTAKELHKAPDLDQRPGQKLLAARTILQGMAGSSRPRRLRSDFSRKGYKLALVVRIFISSGS